jgi:hypothetical protein
MMVLTGFEFLMHGFLKAETRFDIVHVDSVLHHLVGNRIHRLCVTAVIEGDELYIKAGLKGRPYRGFTLPIKWPPPEITTKPFFMLLHFLLMN